MYKIITVLSYQTDSPYVEGVYRPVSQFLITGSDKMKEKFEQVKRKDTLMVMFKDGSREDFVADSIDECLTAAIKYINENNSGSLKPFKPDQ